MPRGFLALLMFIAGLAVLGMLVWPNYQKFRNISGQAKSIQSALEQRERYFLQLSQIFKNLQSDVATLQKFDQALPNEFDPDRLIYFLSLAGKNSGMILNEIEGLSAVLPQGEANLPEQDKQFQLKEITFSAKLTGSYESFKNFLREIESSARLFQVERISILPGFSSENVAQQSLAPQTLKFDVSLKVYSY